MGSINLTNMKKKKYLIVFLFGSLYYVFNHYHLNSMLVGTYNNVNFKDSPIFPRRADTLKILPNNEFYSNRLGYGTYAVTHEFGGTKISFKGRESMMRSVNRTWMGKTKIVMFSDLDHHYMKISSEAKVYKRESESIRTKGEKMNMYVDSKIEELKKRIANDSLENSAAKE